MATVLAATSTPALATRQAVVSRKAISGVAGDSRFRLCICFALLLADPSDHLLCVTVLPAQRRTVCRVSRTTVARYISDLALCLEPFLSRPAFIHHDVLSCAAAASKGSTSFQSPSQQA